MVDFVSVVVLEIKDVFAVAIPFVPKNWPMTLARYRLRIFSIEPADPNIQDATFISG